jgi:hypothetical protein
MDTLASRHPLSLIISRIRIRRGIWYRHRTAVPSKLSVLVAWGMVGNGSVA